LSTRTELFAELEKVRRDGYATCRDESETGLSSVAVALSTSVERLRLAVNVAAPSGRMPAAGMPAIGQMLVDAVAEISERILEPSAQS
jgi:DNA-binding IclR family transcriptional regulator